MRHFLFAILATLASTTTQAGIIYNWVDITINPDTGSAAASYIEIDEAYWTLGGTLSYSGGSIGAPLPGFGILNFRFFTALSEAVSLTTTTCSPAPPYCPSQGNKINDGYWSFGLTFGERLSGGLAANNTFAQVSMGGDSNLWTITDHKADGGPAACYYASCTGGTGYWELNRASIPVPEPSTLVLLFIGFGMILSQRKRLS